MSPSTSNPEALPDIPTLRRLTQSLAMLDAILCPEWQYRYYSFNSCWSADEEMASMRDGCGDEWFLLFGSFGAALKGFAHELPLTHDAVFAAAIQRTLPTDFGSFLREPAFSIAHATFCLWRGHTDSAWSVVSPSSPRRTADDGSAELLRLLDGNPNSYRAWAEDYYERPVPVDAVRVIYEHVPLTADLLATLNRELTLADLRKDVTEINYPVTQRA